MMKGKGTLKKYKTLRGLIKVRKCKISIICMYMVTMPTKITCPLFCVFKFRRGHFLSWQPT